VAGGLGGVVDNYLTEVVSGLQHARGQRPDFEEMPEVAELVEGSQPFDRVSREGDAIAAGDLQQSAGPDGPLQVYMQLDLRKSHEIMKL
jgi:hypothetical protein